MNRQKTKTTNDIAVISQIKINFVEKKVAELRRDYHSTLDIFGFPGTLETKLL